MNVLVTGSAGFIGYHLTLNLLKKKNFKVFGVDNLNTYYDVDLKRNRNKILKKYNNFFFKKININNRKILFKTFKGIKIDIIINLAAQAGVRNSISDPEDYFSSNIKGFFNILELSKLKKIKQLLYASSSSVYGNSNKFPMNERFETSRPISFYAASKKCNEIMAHSYSHIYNLKTIGLRFFTVYGPYGRPDMALFKFTNNILKNKKIELYNYGNHLRDFTYIDDIVDGILSVAFRQRNSHEVFSIFNIGSGKSLNLIDYIIAIEKKLGKKAKIKKLPLQKGDVIKTHSDISLLKKYSNYKPRVGIQKGVSNFIEWFLNYYYE